MASVREPDFDRLIIELETKSAQLVDGAKQGFQPSRSQLEDFVWKTGRVTRKLVEPERSEACKIFWSECKGILKDIIIVERFNPSVFFAECIRKDIVETNVVACLGKLISYTKRRKSGVITAPKEVLGPADPEAKKRKLDEEQEAAESKRKGKKGKGKGKKGKGQDRNLGDLADRLNSMADSLTRWDDEDSDPDEVCPDLEKFGSCSYGRQCGFASCQKDYGRGLATV
mmetsp:Transcript_9576/g.25448  ORF Transcript_9576/g.25448 Transcript_9576/m.25448 type:complete len:228 (-) Transcript_9576:161-844(-)